MKLVAVWLFVFLLNIPFGYWRESVKKFSWKWVVAIHAPVPLVIMARMAAGYGFKWWVIVPSVIAYFAGQFLGSRLSRRWRGAERPVSGCFFMDIRKRVWVA